MRLCRLFCREAEHLAISSLLITQLNSSEILYMKTKPRQRYAIAVLAALALLAACATHKSHDRQESHYHLNDSMANNQLTQYLLKSTDSLNLRFFEITATLIDSFPELNLRTLELSHKTGKIVTYNDSTQIVTIIEENDSIHQFSSNYRDSGNQTKVLILLLIAIIITLIFALKLFKL